MKFDRGFLDSTHFIALFRMPHDQFFDLVERKGGDKEDAHKLLDELMDCIYTAFPQFPREADDGRSG